jgi:UDP-GlcNAc:undecaprenyl-phosphate GlcNAc-1-phosphate transferase
VEWVQGAIIFVVAFAVTYLMVPVSRDFAIRHGAIDYPNARRVNQRPVPRCGGIAIFCGLAAAFIVGCIGYFALGWTYPHSERSIGLEDVNMPMVCAGVALIFVVGLIDDLRQLNAGQKLLGQIVAATLVAAAGVSFGVVRWFGTGDYIELGWADIPLTVLYLVIFMNIMNLIDGLDGLAAGIAAIVSCALLVLVIERGNTVLVLTCLSLLAVCLAFLRFNFYPASVFMGDSGSHMLGLVIGIISVAGVVRTQSVIVMLVPLVIAGVPALDTLSAIVRRNREGESIYHADKEHIHHRLMRAGFGQRKSVLILWACTAALSVAGIIAGTFSGPVRWTTLIVLAVVVFVVIKKFDLFGPVLEYRYQEQDGRGDGLGPDASGVQSHDEDTDAGADGEHADGSGSDAERTGAERGGVERTGAERGSVELGAAERTDAERATAEHTAAKRAAAEHAADNRATTERTADGDHAGDD